MGTVNTTPVNRSGSISNTAFRADRVDLAKSMPTQISSAKWRPGVTTVSTTASTARPGSKQVAQVRPATKLLAIEVTIDGVKVAKYPEQADLTTVRTGATYPAKEIAKLNPTVYVVDGFERRSVTVGSAAQRKSISHGDFCLGVIKSGLPTAKIVKVEATNSSGDVTIRSMGQSIDNVIAREAKLQNTSKPDLSRVFISMSLGESKLTLTPYELISAPIARFTALGGTIYASAGNRLLNTTGANPGVGLVYATQSTVGSALSSNPKPAQSLRSGTFELGDGQINKIPTNRIDPTSHVYVGAGTLSQRYNPATGAVENQNPKGDWISAVDATRVTADPVKGMAATGPLNNIRPSAEVTAKDVERFDAWRTTSENTAIAKHPMPAGSKKKATYDDLTTAEKNSLNARSKTEFTRRFGTTSVITVAHSKTAALMIQGSDRAAFFDQSLPTGLTPQTAYIPAEAFVLDNKRPDEGTTDFYSRDASGLMRHAISYVSSSVSTSAATPDMVVRAVQDRAVRLAKTKGVGGSSQP